MAEKTYTLTKFVISKIELGAAGKRGDEARTPWQIVNFWIDHPKAKDKKFSKFCNPDKDNRYPYVGARVKVLTFSLKTNGKFENLNVESIEYMPGYEPDTGAIAQKIKGSRTEAGEPSTGVKAGDPMPFDEAPPEEMASVEEITDTAPPEHRSAHIMGKCIDSMTTVIRELLIINEAKAKTSKSRVDMSLLACREMVGTHSVLLYDEVMKGLKRWENEA